jgi:ABC-type sugar transport system permease subunit
MVTMLQGLIWSAHNFSLVYIMTGGGPVYASEVLTTHLWRTAFPDGQIGQAAAAGGLMMIGLGIIGTFWVLKLLRRRVA